MKKALLKQVAMIFGRKVVAIKMNAYKYIIVVICMIMKENRIYIIELGEL